uniref:Uncharacterized protein n=1 Tax=Lygus hesperus TaxID=30085 RepID=A0A146LND6_LYGHE
MVELLTQRLLSCFDATILSQHDIPAPPHRVITHGTFSLRSCIFSHRSLEGRSKYPPHLIATVQFRFSKLGDPLVDVAHLALSSYLPPPEGVYGLGKHIRELFPTPQEILEMYCNTRGYMRHIERTRREDIFAVYCAALCLQRATITIAELAARQRDHVDGLPYADSRNIAFADQMAQRGLDLLAQRQQAKL